MPRRALAILALACCTALPSCGRRETLTVGETKDRYAKSIVEGAAIGASWTVQAERWDKNEGLLIDVRLDDNDGKYYYAERARIIVDPMQDTIALKLENVTGAIAASEGSDDASGLVTTASIVTDPVRVAFDITP